ncbi:MFS transporter [Nocardia sp. CDC159]|uniref:MFS transporter n=1 Tax=Nocardia pulmonis TaxID=2951408 RepID=A0A9X2J2A5_9NOCA|nr:MULTISPECIES: MFS transporter [Nocardia]MCM6777821.1 MFS transporter [Nocardia pulmonis]MCM6790705.1 MFS transporter [Nocardia sp. CDC159]
MAASTLAPPIRIARAAVFAVFGLNGFLSAIWVVHIPAVTERTGVSNAALGMLILLMAGSAILGMQAAGPLADRFGSRALVAAAAGWLSLAVIGPGLASGPLALAAALMVFGFGNGALDVSMNTQAVQVEREYPRPIMGAFHALFSCGGLVGSLAGAAALHLGWEPRLTMTLAAVFGVATVALCVPRMLPRTGRSPAAPAFPPTPADGPDLSAAATARNKAARTAFADDSPERASIDHEHAELDRRADNAAPEARIDTSGERPDGRHHPAHRRAAHEAPHTTDRPVTEGGRPDPGADRRALPGNSTRQDAEPARKTAHRRVFALAAIAFAFLMTEGVANDWSTLQVRDELGASEATAALAFAAFSTTMTIGRFGSDRVSGRFGPVAVVRWGALLAAVGLILIIASPWVPLAVIGWALMGIGLSGGIPQIFTAAGNLGTATAATDMSRVFGLGYLGFLAGPSVIGWLSKPFSLTQALIFPLVLVLVCAWFAPIVRGATS